MEYETSCELPKKDIDDKYKIRLAAFYGKYENKALDMIINPVSGMSVFIVTSYGVEENKGTCIDDAISYL